jgi:hypothetical protein
VFKAVQSSLVLHVGPSKRSMAAAMVEALDFRWLVICVPRVLCEVWMSS